MPPPDHKPDLPPHPTAILCSDRDPCYPDDAFEFVRFGLSHAATKIHPATDDPAASRHITGQQLCHGLRDLSVARWGMMAPVVLNRWNIHQTDDFGRIVFTLIECGEMSKTEQDTLDDFRQIFDFAAAFGSEYQIDRKAIDKALQSGS